MNKIFHKLKEARIALGLNQSNAAACAGIKQRDISQLESGQREFIPTAYIQFLNIKGVDINSLFNDNVDLIVEKVSPKVLPKVSPNDELLKFEKKIKKELKDDYDTQIAIVLEEVYKNRKTIGILNTSIKQINEFKKTAS